MKYGLEPNPDMNDKAYRNDVISTIKKFAKKHSETSEGLDQIDKDFEEEVKIFFIKYRGMYENLIFFKLGMTKLNYMV